MRSLTDNNAELVNKARAFGKGSTNLADVFCYYCKKKGHTTHNCPPLKAKLEKKKKAEGANKTEGEKTAAITKFAGQTSAIDNHEANVTSSNTFHWNTVVLHNHQ